MRLRPPLLARTRRLALLLLASACGGCFALFSLDGYGPPAESALGGDGAPVGSDDGALADGQSADGGFAGRLVFVSSVDLAISDKPDADAGDRFNGVAGADAVCAALAAAARLPGSYKAWIADQAHDDGNATSPKHPTSFSLADDSRALFTTTGQLVAESLAELIDAGPRVAINVTEAAGVLPEAPGVPTDPGTAGDPLLGCPDGGLVWSGIRGNGAATPQNCQIWTTSGVVQTGGVGRMAKDPSEWTHACDFRCDQRARLYCFQQ